ncbi:glutamate-5-semialdehyde dehydrogenase [bacterium]|nr:glutamate-5-semialdehyde dehydrogenase [bacterium]
MLSQDSIQTMAKKAKKASLRIANLDSSEKNRLLKAISERVKKSSQLIADSNLLDIQEAQKLVADGSLSKPLLDRLKLTDEKIVQLSTYLDEVARLEDPVGKKQFAIRLAEGMELERVTCPIGVVAVIFESRPEVVIQVTALSLKSGNAVILKGGREAFHSNKILFQIINEVLVEFDLNNTVNLIETRDDVAVLLNEDRNIDLIIPRGSNEFVKYIQDHTKIPVLGHSSGICHIYIDDNIDVDKTIKIVVDAKTDYPSACNALETLLIHRSAADSILPRIIRELSNYKVRMLGCEKSVKIANQNNLKLDLATEQDWSTEYTDLILSIKTVDSLSDAMDHINTFGSHHTDTIITENRENAELFLKQVDSGCVFHNASTRFSDGYVFGLGAEVGISTNKTHSRGPVGLDGMVIYKYLLRGDGHLRSSFSGPQAEKFLHIPL